VFDSPEAVKHYLQLHIAARPHEAFAALFLDAQQRLIALEELFRGTLMQPPASMRAKSSCARCTTRLRPSCWTT